MEPWRAVGALNEGVEAQNGAAEGLCDNGAELHHFNEEQDSNKIRIKVTGRIRFGINVNRWIRIRVKVMRIRNTFPSCSCPVRK